MCIVFWSDCAKSLTELNEKKKIGQTFDLVPIVFHLPTPKGAPFGVGRLKTPGTRFADVFKSFLNNSRMDDIVPLRPLRDQ